MVALKMTTKLWYMTQTPHSRAHHAATTNATTQFHDVVITCDKSYESRELWHHRLGHVGENAMNDIAKVTTGTPAMRRKHHLFKCPCCQDGKMTKMVKGHKTPLRLLNLETGS